MDTQQIEADVIDLVLDVDNPRFYHLRLKAKGKLSEKQIEDEILKDDALPALIKAIRRAGVTDPIWVRRLEDDKD